MKEANGFRTTLVGGFCREDVLNYLEKNTKEVSQRLEALELERNQALLETDALNDDNIALKEKNAELLERMGELTLSAEHHREDLAQYRAQLQTCESALQEEQARVRALEQQNAALTEQLATLTAFKEQYDADKEHLAELELEALRRIKDMEARAYAKVEHTRAQAVELITATKLAMQKISGRWRDNINAITDAAAEHSRSATELFGRMDESIYLLEQVISDQKTQAEPDDHAPLLGIVAKIQPQTQDEGEIPNGTL